MVSAPLRPRHTMSPSTLPLGRPLRECAPMGAEAFRQDVLPAGEPLVIRGLASHWPAVQAAREGRLPEYLRRLGGDTPCDMLVGAPGNRGRFFYDDALRELNFSREQDTLGRVIDELLALEGPAAQGEPTRSVATQALDSARATPAFVRENPSPLGLEGRAPRLWLNNRITVAAHQDAMRNLAVVVGGRRRFTVLPPEEIANLYAGPREFSPAGTPVSLVDFELPDLQRHPRFGQARERAQWVELQPGDALYMPYMWWHHVQSLDGFNLLANYWWSETPPPAPGLDLFDVTVHVRLALSATSPEQRRAWRATLAQALQDDMLPPEVPADRAGLLGRFDERAREVLRKRLGSLLSQP